MKPKDEDTQTRSAGRGRVLVVDDQEHMCWVLSKILSERGHEVKTAYSAAGALRLASKFDAEVAVVDYRLPDSDGIALILAMTARLPRLRSILMTSYGSASLREHAIDGNLFAYIEKPFSNDVLIRTAEDALRAWETGGDSLAPGARARTCFPGRAPPKAEP